MTTNKLAIIPPELYRPGRIDMTIKIPRLVISEAKAFAQKVFKSVVGVQPDLKQLKALGEALKATGEDDFSHAGVSEIVYMEIKRHNWL
jgi:ATP-dependent 26S proteasome regulatory subunit